MEKKAHLKSLIANDRVDEVIAALYELLNLYLSNKKDDEVSMLFNIHISNSGKYKNIKQKILFGILDDDAENLQMAKVRKTILDLIDEIPNYVFAYKVEVIDSYLLSNNYDRSRKLLSQYSQNLVLYLPLYDDIADYQVFSSQVKVLTFRENYKPVFDKQNGFFFDGSVILQLENTNLPSGNKPRSFNIWCKLVEYPSVKGALIEDTDPPKFIFSYGKEQHGMAYGLYYGIPFFESALNSDFGFRVFTWCHPLMWRLGNKNCDSKHFGEIKSSKWCNIASSYDGSNLRYYVDGKEVGQEVIYWDTILPNNLINVGAFLPKREIPYSGYNYVGFIREFMLFDICLTEAEIINLYDTGKNILNI